MHDLVARSNALNRDDKIGGMHEGRFSTTNGVISVAPAGPAYQPEDPTAHIVVPTAADTTLKVHVHPEGMALPRSINSFQTDLDKIYPMLP